MQTRCLLQRSAQADAVASEFSWDATPSSRFSVNRDGGVAAPEYNVFCQRIETVRFTD